MLRNGQSIWVGKAAAGEKGTRQKAGWLAGHAMLGKRQNAGGKGEGRRKAAGRKDGWEVGGIQAGRQAVGAGREGAGRLGWGQLRHG